MRDLSESAGEDWKDNNQMRSSAKFLIPCSRSDNGSNAQPGQPLREGSTVLSPRGHEGREGKSMQAGRFVSRRTRGGYSEEAHLHESSLATFWPSFWALWGATLELASEAATRDNGRSLVRASTRGPKTRLGPMNVNSRDICISTPDRRARHLHHT